MTRVQRVNEVSALRIWLCQIIFSKVQTVAEDWCLYQTYSNSKITERVILQLIWKQENLQIWIHHVIILQSFSIVSIFLQGSLKVQHLHAHPVIISLLLLLWFWFHDFLSLKTVLVPCWFLLLQIYVLPNPVETGKIWAWSSCLERGQTKIIAIHHHSACMRILICCVGFILHCHKDQGWIKIHRKH